MRYANFQEIFADCSEVVAASGDKTFFSELKQMPNPATFDSA